MDRLRAKKLNLMWDRAIEAMLQYGTVNKAAQALGIHHTSLRKWLTDPDFVAGLEAARSQALDATVNELRLTASDAVKALQRALKCGDHAIEVQAAKAVLDHLGIKQRAAGASAADGTQAVKVEIVFGTQEKGTQARIVDITQVEDGPASDQD